MRIGTSLRSGYGTVEAREGARWMVERAEASRDAGLDSLFVGDHHNVPVPYYQNVPMLGRLLAAWDDRPAGCLFLLPLWHPVLVAEQVGTLAAIARGRFILQCAIGGGAEQFASMGVSLRDRAALFEAGLGVIKRLCAGEEVSLDAPWPIERARIAPIPPEPLEVWIGGAAPRAIDRAARLGDAFLVGPETPLPDAARMIDEYRERCAAHDRPPETIAIRRDVHVGASTADAARVAGPIVEAGYRGFDPSAPVYGSIEQVIDSLTAIGELGYTDVIVRHLADDQTEVLLSIERLAEVRAALA